MLSDDKKEVLRKVLAMTTSDKDGEALNAIRLANKFIHEASLTWEIIIDRLNCSHCNGEDSVESMLRTLIKDSAPGSWASEFATSLGKSYRINPKLTTRQMDTLKRLFASFKGR
jgi:hypothetical protein